MEYYSQFLILAYKQKITKQFSRDVSVNIFAVGCEPLV